MKKIIFILCFVFLPNFAWASEITVVYTGNSYANLYPCGNCPASVGGGIARRTTKIKEIRNKTKNIILIDAGNFTAGSNLDQASINPQMDKQRSTFYYQAMDKIGYDAVVVGDGEFNLGVDFAKESIKKYKFKFISANMRLEGVLPYYIKEFSRFKVAVIGLSPQSIHKKVGLEVEDYEVAIGAVLGKIKNKVDFIILASSLGDEMSLLIANKFKEIQVILSSGNMTGSAPYDKVGDVIVLRPSFRSQEIRFANFDVKKNKIIKWEFKKEALPLDIVEDQQTKEMFPACFMDANCPHKEGLISNCQNPGTLNAVCAYYEPKKIEATLITDKNCPFCSVEMSQKALKSIFLGIEFKTLDYNDNQAKELIKKYAIESLPCFILPADIKNEKVFSNIANSFEEKEGKFLLKKELAGLFLFLKRNETPRRIDLFLNPYEQNVENILKDLLNFNKDNKVDLQIHLIIPKESAAGYPEEELKMALAVKKLFPEKFFDYLMLRIKDIKKTSCTDSLGALGLDYKKIMELSKSKDIEGLVKDNNKLAQELGVAEGNVLLINNNRIFKVFQIKGEDLKKFF
ncbi:MAG: hypothetical protein Q8O30_05865 [Candidatus Omnitrophota bacterium]|nr:hypothetical protein [Candidatus Omnitrophota bacterium]